MSTPAAAPEPAQLAPPVSPEYLAWMETLVTEDDTPVDSIYSEKQQRLLTETLYSSWQGPGEGRPFLATANVGLFYAVGRPPLVPDMLLSLDVHVRAPLREKRNRSYFVWEYGKPPDAVVEVVSGLEGEEAGKKLRLYAQIGILYYVIWDRFGELGAERLRKFVLRDRAYVPLEGDWFPVLELGMTLWRGAYEEDDDEWLRWCDRQGELIPTGRELAEAAQLRAETQQERADTAQFRAETERQRAEAARQRADAERQRAETERQRADAERQRAERLEAQLRSLGAEPKNGE
jgi:Uma2 family endonuclease